MTLETLFLVIAIAALGSMSLVVNILSRGGSHSYQNARLAHRGCNARKGNAMPGEPRYEPA